jgi:hypothetical protein
MDTNTNVDKIKELFTKIINNEEFIRIIDEQINNIMKNKIIDHNDIPSIIYIIVETINHINTFSITIDDDDIKKLILLIIEFIMSKYSIIPSENNKELYNNIINLSIKLLMTELKLNKQYIFKFTDLFKFTHLFKFINLFKFTDLFKSHPKNNVI